METQRKLVLSLVALVTVTLMVFESGKAVAAQKETKTNDAIQTVIVDRLSRQGLLTRDNIHLTISNDTITVTGTVSNLADKDRALGDVQKVGEGYTMIDNLAIESADMSDENISGKIVEALQGSIFYGMSDWVDVSVDKGVVSMTGWASDSWHRTLFVDLAKKVAGVTAVHNEIKLVPPTPWNDNIRRKAALLIYDNPDLNIFSRTISPPIHVIVVDDQIVYLEGYVSSKFQKNWIAMIINGDTHPNQLINHLKVG
jgi:osmotically-inducible protein OsmY